MRHVMTTVLIGISTLAISGSRTLGEQPGRALDEAQLIQLLELQIDDDAIVAKVTKSGIAFTLESFVVPPSEFSFDPATKKFTDLKLGVTPKYDTSRYVVSDLDAKAHDGVMVPLSLVQQKGASGAQVTLIQAYGSYGISQLADFSPRAVSFLEAGGTYASCHVRGGGELGDAWRLGGKDQNKPNTWRDLIACPKDMRQTIRGLGFRRMNQVVERPDNPAVRGMILKVRHLVVVEESN